MLLLAAINGYFRDLGDENVLDPTYDNTAGVDVTSQRNAWIDSGKAEAAEWDDGKVIPYLDTITDAFLEEAAEKQPGQPD